MKKEGIQSLHPNREIKNIPDPEWEHTPKPDF